MKKSKHCIGLTLIDRQTCIKYLTLTASLMKQIYQDKIVSMGALGTHFLEHFFSKLRRISHNDNISEMFIWSLISNILFEELSRENKIEVKPPKRLSSSGAIITPNPIFHENRIFGSSLLSMLKLFLKSFNMMPFIHLFPFNLENLGEYVYFEDNFIYPSKVQGHISTRKTGMVATGGLNQMKNFASHSQVQNLVNTK